jgi:hypothetical protein
MGNQLNFFRQNGSATGNNLNQAENPGPDGVPPQNQNPAGDQPVGQLPQSHLNFIQSVFRNNEELGFIPLRGDGLGVRPRIRAGIKKATPAELSFDINESTFELHPNPKYPNLKSLTFSLDTNCDINVTLYQFCTEYRESEENKNRVKEIKIDRKGKMTEMRFSKGINVEIPIGQC